VKQTDRSEFDRLVAENMSEDELLRNILDLALRLGFLIHHDRPARTATGWRTAIQGTPGFPDLVLAHPDTRRCLVAELKSEKGRLEPFQKEWISALRPLGAIVWRPRDWISGLIEGMLRDAAEREIDR
jgi:hypothetical protein